MTESVRILHISDTHGLPRKRVPDGVDVIVHSGDMMPNSTRGIRQIEVPFQRSWISENAEQWRTWIGDRRFIFCPGNHDYIDPCPTLRSVGVAAYNVHEDPRTIAGLEFVGFPFVPHLGGEWNYECHEDEIELRFEELLVCESAILALLPEESE